MAQRCREKRDSQLAPVFNWCKWCGGEIYIGQRYYATENGLICEECFPAYSREYFLPALRTAMVRRFGYDDD